MFSLSFFQKQKINQIELFLVFLLNLLSISNNREGNLRQKKWMKNSDRYSKHLECWTTKNNCHHFNSLFCFTYFVGCCVWYHACKICFLSRLLVLLQYSKQLYINICPGFYYNECIQVLSIINQSIKFQRKNKLSTIEMSYDKKIE